MKKNNIKLTKTIFFVLYFVSISTINRGGLMYKKEIEEKLKKYNETDTFVMSFGFVLILCSIFLIFKTFELSPNIFFGLATFALYLGIVSLIKPGNLKKVLSGFSLPFSFLITLYFQSTGADLNNWNNALSLLALSLSIMLLPSSRIKNQQEEEKIEVLKGSILKKNEQIVRIEQEIDQRIERVENERDQRIQRVEKEKEQHIATLKSETKQYIKDIKEEHSQKILELNKKYRNDLLTARQHNSLENDLLKTEIKNLQERIKKINLENNELLVGKNNISKNMNNNNEVFKSISNPTSTSELIKSINKNSEMFKSVSNPNSTSELIKSINKNSEMFKSISNPTSTSELIKSINKNSEMFKSISNRTSTSKFIEDYYKNNTNIKK